METDKKFKKEAQCYQLILFSLKTGVLQWKKDYNLGAMNFEQAAKLYKECKNSQNEKEALKFAIECNEKLDYTWAVGRNYEALLNPLIDNSSQDYKELVEWTHQADVNFKISDSGMKQLKVLNEVVKYLNKRQQYEFSEQIILEALAKAGKVHAPSTLSYIICSFLEILIETQQYHKVGDLYMNDISKFREEQIKYPSSQYALVIIVMHIFQDETARENQELEQLIQYDQSIYIYYLEAVDQMLNSYEKGDQNQFNDALLKASVTSICPPNIVFELRKVKVRVINIQPKQDNNQQQVDQGNEEVDYQQELEKKIL
ncbi:unnamed protein product (macronuclear) [Paramecium tetraurelia]|uniref:Gamma-soluble NSF attachment protein n=1 Tax=Paramecium tetraurelia TaxID=5888 RepID=A0C3J9_PARTE|nr:uncharacterized protein GSPATT00034845001 [Paramecium tetraurelia]CAK65366.1 unnamed protein product [Paramecium tetraurelia]|eukprot:XP_001432763.1 hypothetical protein (macronuclear) [Paramecium tetraurelia strain d4-2]